MEGLGDILEGKMRLKELILSPKFLVFVTMMAGQLLDTEHFKNTGLQEDDPEFILSTLSFRGFCYI